MAQFYTPGKAETSVAAARHQDVSGRCFMVCCDTDEQEKRGVNKNVVNSYGSGKMAQACCPGKRQSPTSAAGGRGRPGTHNEAVCHATGERRRDIIDQIKTMLNEFDERCCKVAPTPTTTQGATRRLGEYEEYIRKHCQSWVPPNPRPPLITSVQTHEVRPTEDYDQMRVNNNEYITYVDARHRPPPPSCDCAKRNGLQDQCEKPGCKPPTLQCLASNPGPCCPPSMGLPGKTQPIQPSSVTPRYPVAGIPCLPTGAQHPHQESPPRGIFSAGQPRYTTLPTGEPGVYVHMPTQPSPPRGTPPQGQTYCEPCSTNGAGVFAQTSKQPSPHRGMVTPGLHSAGQEMVCFCEAEPTNLPSGQKYMCCPAPLNGCQ